MSRGFAFVSSRVVLSLGIVSGLLTGSGCSYFHPAFLTHSSHASGGFAQGERGILVCERRSLVRQDCAVMPQSEIDRMLAEISRRY